MSKTAYLIICANKIRNKFKNFTIKVDKYVIHPSNTVKILGIYITNKLTHDTEIGKLSANLHNRIHNLNKMREYTTFKM